MSRNDWGLSYIDFLPIAYNNNNRKPNNMVVKIQRPNTIILICNNSFIEKIQGVNSSNTAIGCKQHEMQRAWMFKIPSWNVHFSPKVPRAQVQIWDKILLINHIKSPTGIGNLLVDQKYINKGRKLRQYVRRPSWSRKVSIDIYKLLSTTRSFIGNWIWWAKGKVECDVLLIEGWIFFGFWSLCWWFTFGNWFLRASETFFHMALIGLIETTAGIASRWTLSEKGGKPGERRHIGIKSFRTAAAPHHARGTWIMLLNLKRLVRTVERGSWNGQHKGWWLNCHRRCGAVGVAGFVPVRHFEEVERCLWKNMLVRNCQISEFPSIHCIHHSFYEHQRWGKQPCWIRPGVKFANLQVGLAVS